jgi:four helix bundle protein
VARSYRELIAWQKARNLAVQTYKATESFPKSETYGLTSQVRRAMISVVSNIAEGQKEGSRQVNSSISLDSHGAHYWKRRRN